MTTRANTNLNVNKLLMVNTDLKIITSSRSKGNQVRSVNKHKRSLSRDKSKQKRSAKHSRNASKEAMNHR